MGYIGMNIILHRFHECNYIDMIVPIATRGSSEWGGWQGMCDGAVWLHWEESSWGFHEEGRYPGIAEQYQQGNYIA